MRSGVNRIRVISFDGDDTLWDFSSVMRRALTEALAEMQRLVPAARDLTVPRMIALRDEALRDAPRNDEGRADLIEVRLEGFRRALAVVDATERGDGEASELRLRSLSALDRRAVPGDARGAGGRSRGGTDWV